jgi:hypothetical protein
MDADHNDLVEWRQHDDRRMAGRPSVLLDERPARLASAALCTRTSIQAGNNLSIHAG